MTTHPAATPDYDPREPRIALRDEQDRWLSARYDAAAERVHIGTTVHGVSLDRKQVLSLNRWLYEVLEDAADAAGAGREELYRSFGLEAPDLDPCD